MTDNSDSQSPESSDSPRFTEDGFPEDPLSWVRPEPSPEERKAARILARLIQFGHVPVPVPDLPEHWRRAFDEVFLTRSRPRPERFRAFIESFEERDPNFIPMHQALNDAMPDTDDRLQQNRALYMADDALKPPPKLEWCVEEMLARPSLTMLVGNPGTKKTYLAIDLAVCVALGKPWLGRPVNQGPVLFIDEETGLHQLWARFNSALKAHNSGWGLPLGFVSLGGYNLRDEAEADVLIHRALSIDARFIVIDALANLMRGAGESNLATIQPVLFNLRRMAEYCNAAVLVIHHTNRHGLFRGSSAISAAVDLMLSIESEPADSLVTLRTLKARFVAPPPFCARANFTSAADGSKRFQLTASTEIPSPQTVVPLPDDRQNSAIAIMDFLLHNPASTRQAITAHIVGFSPTTIRSVLHKLKHSGLIKRTNGSRRGKEAIYELSN
jgi:hypothetical protein